jgi:hypothetical protein
MSHQELKLGDAIKAFLAQVRMDDRLLNRRIKSIWPEVLGKGVDKFTEGIYFSKGVLYLNVSAAALRHEILSNKAVIMEKINEALLKKVVKDIKVK